MQKLLEGIHQFQESVFGPRRKLFERLVAGQHPEALFITCSDSRVDPHLITQSDPGDLFTLRNAGNIVPPFGATNGGEGATIEFAISALNIEDIVVCGHSHCGAMKALLNRESVAAMPTVAEWLAMAESTRRIVVDKYPDVAGDKLLSITVQENVLVQLENLRTHPAVAAALARGKVKLHGWVYKIETGEVFEFDPERGQFSRLGMQSSVALAYPELRLNGDII